MRHEEAEHYDEHRTTVLSYHDHLLSRLAKMIQTQAAASSSINRKTS
jgi:hypothetical protein